MDTTGNGYADHSTISLGVNRENRWEDKWNKGGTNERPNTCPDKHDDPQKYADHTIGQGFVPGK